MDDGCLRRLSYSNTWEERLERTNIREKIIARVIRDHIKELATEWKTISALWVLQQPVRN